MVYFSSKGFSNNRYEKKRIVYTFLNLISKKRILVNEQFHELSIVIIK